MMISLEWKDIREKVLNADNLFMIGLFLYLIQSFLSRTTLSTQFGSSQMESIYQMIRYASYGLMLLSLCEQMISQRFLVVVIAAFAITFLIAEKTTDKTLLFLVIVAVGGYQQDYKKIIKMTFWVYFLLFLLTLVLGHAGIIPDYVSDLLTRERNFYGFIWATVPQTYILFITMFYVCMREEKISYAELIILAVTGYYFFRHTDARLVYMVEMLFLLIIFLLKVFHVRSIRSSALKKILICLPVLICILTIATYFMYNPDNALWQKVNSALSGRMVLGTNLLQKYGISFFGQHIVLKGHNVNSITVDNSNSLYNYVDSSYLQITLLYGISGMVLIIAGMTYLVWKCLKAGDMYLLTMVMCVLLLSITEDCLVKLGFNLFVLIFASVYSSKREIRPERFITEQSF